MYYSCLFGNPLRSLPTARYCKANAFVVVALEIAAELDNSAFDNFAAENTEVERIEAEHIAFEPQFAESRKPLCSALAVAVKIAVDGRRNWAICTVCIGRQFPNSENRIAYICKYS